MGTLKEKKLGGYSKARAAKETQAERMIRLSKHLGDRLFESLPFLMDDVLDDENPVIELRVRVRQGDSVIAHAKRSTIDGEETIAFGTGDDLIEALIGLETRIASRGYSPAKKWNPDTRKFE